jgi:hypothetical protein
VNKICEENIHEESPVRNASDEDFGEIWTALSLC